MAALEALPLSVKASALPFAIFSAASPLLVSASEVASAICSAGCLAMAGNPSKMTSATLPRVRWQNSDTSNLIPHKRPSRSIGAGLPGRVWSEHGAHQNAEIEPGNVDQIAIKSSLR